jgi:PadR family transcriptional regulator PadR
MGRPRHSSRQIDRLLAAFMRDPGMWRYGYELAKDAGIPTGTLYPALLRLADDDYLEDHWELPDDRGGRVRRMYRLTPSGMGFAEDRLVALGRDAIRRGGVSIGTAPTPT